MRIVERADGQRSAWGFVEVSNGLVWKCGTWKAPALNYPRGCVFDEGSRAELSTHVYGLGDAPAYHDLG